jgi:hypothetical protein
MSKRKNVQQKEEFSGYGNKSKIVRKLVDEDDFNITTKFYESLGIAYQPDFSTAMQSIKLAAPTTALPLYIIATRIRIGDKENINSELNFHAVCLVRVLNNIYFFDPNGYIRNPTYTFMYPNVKGGYDYLNTDVFLSKFAGQIRYSKREGIQIFNNSPDDEGYINGGGYCMFYIYCFISNLINAFNRGVDLNSYVTNIFQHDYANDTGIFPDDLGIYSRDVIKSIFK